MKKLHQKLEQLQQQWSTEMATFQELQQTNKVLTEELRECAQKLDTLALRRNSGTTPPVGFRN